MEILLAGIAMGIGGTLAMDVWAWVLARTGVAPFPNWGKVGRWVANLPGGTVFHENIDHVAPVPGELPLGWVFHYAVGLTYGVVFAFLAGADWRAAPTFPPAWLFGMVTLGAGWFLLQPGLGMGWAAAKTPNPWKVRVLGLVAHSVFAFGMYSAALAV